MNEADHVKRILVVMPAHNEAGRIGAVIRGVKAVLPAADVAVINDASTDATADEAWAAGAGMLTEGAVVERGGRAASAAARRAKPGPGQAARPPRLTWSQAEERSPTILSRSRDP